MRALPPVRPCGASATEPPGARWVLLPVGAAVGAFATLALLWVVAGRPPRPSEAPWFLLPFGAVVLLLVLLGARRTVSRGRTGCAARAFGPDAPARETLDRRYAAGESSREEFLRTARDPDGSP